MAQNRRELGKIANNGSRKDGNALPGRSKQGSSKYNQHGSVKSILQPHHRSGTPGTPVPVQNLDGLVARAVKQKRMADLTATRRFEMRKAYNWLASGGGTEGGMLDSAIGEVLASPVLRAELKREADLRAQLLRFEFAKTVAPDAGSEELPERERVLLHIRPSRKQDPKLSSKWQRLVSDCAPSPRAAAWSAIHIAVTTAAVKKLNNGILVEISHGAAATGTSSEKSYCVALQAVLSERLICEGLEETPMRCVCRREDVQASGLFESGLLLTLKLRCGLSIDVERQPDPFEQVPVRMSGLPSAVSNADASYMVASLLQGSSSGFKLVPSGQALTPPSTVSGSEDDGLKLLRMTVRTSSTSAAQASGSHLGNREARDLRVTLRRDAVQRLPSALPVLVVQADGKGAVTVVRFRVEKHHGHTDTTRCHGCGTVGHLAAMCTVMRDGYVPRFTCLASVPETAVTRKAATSTKQPARQQQAQSQRHPQSDNAQHALEPQVSDNEGFVTFTGNRRTDNKHLNSAAARVPASTGPIVGVSAAVTTTSKQATVTQNDNEADMAEAIAASARLGAIEALQQQMESRELDLTACLDTDNTVLPGQVSQLQAHELAHAACTDTLQQAQASAAAVVARLATVPEVKSPSGKAKATKESTKPYQQKRSQAQEQQAVATARMQSAQHELALLDALVLRSRDLSVRMRDCNQPVLEQSVPASPTGDAPLHTPELCDSPMSAIIELPSDTQESAVRSPVQHAMAEAAVTGAASVTPTRQRSCGKVSQAAALEAHRDATLAQRTDEFDRAERTGVEQEQQRLQTVRLDTEQQRSDQQPSDQPSSGQCDSSASSDQQPSAQTPTAAAQCAEGGESETEKSDGSFDSGPSESSESECSDAPAPAARSRRVAATQGTPAARTEQRLPLTRSKSVQGSATTATTETAAQPASKAKRGRKAATTTTSLDDDDTTKR